MPVRNGGKYLKSAVDSILRQKGVDFELILIDDHSSDNAIRDLQQDSRLKFFKNDGRGIVDALNLGLAKASHEYFARMDADDIAHPDRLAEQTRYLSQNPDIHIAGSKVAIFNEQEPIGTGFAIYQEWLNGRINDQQISEHMFVECCLAHPTFMAKRSLFLELGGYADNGWPEDYDLILRAYMQGYRFGKPETQALLEWRDHSARLSRNDQMYRRTAFLACKAHYLAKHLKKSTKRDVWIWGAGNTGAKLASLLTRDSCQISGFIDVNEKLTGRTKRNVPVEVIDFSQDPADFVLGQRLILICVNARGVAQKIEEFLLMAGANQGEDFLRVS